MSLNLSWITDGLAIGGSFPCEGIDALAREHRIAAIVDLREEACDDVALLATHGIDFLYLPTPDHHGLGAAMLRDGIAFVGRHLEARRRVLVHCEHGIGRSALLGLCVLVAHGHAPLAALELVKSRRARVSPNVAQYEAWAAWLRDTGREAPPFEAFAAVAYRGIGGHG